MRWLAVPGRRPVRPARRSGQPGPVRRSGQPGPVRPELASAWRLRLAPPPGASAWRLRLAPPPGASAGLHELPDQPGGLARGTAHLDADLLECLLLRLRRSRRAGDDRSRVAHGLAFRRGEPGDVGDHWLGHVGVDIGGGAFFRVAAYLADHHDRVGLWIILEGLEAVDVRGPA